MSGKRALRNIAVTSVSLALAFGVLVIVELLVRVTTDVGRLGTSADLFVNQAFGESIGNAPNVKTVTFGVEVHTDERGFRTDPFGVAPIEENADVLLILGDSVAFGVGVEFEQTVAARLAFAFPEFHTYNTAVIGYGVNDYHNVTRVVFPRYADTINQVLVIFCLNDVSVVSAAEIKAKVAHAIDKPAVLTAGVDVQSLKDISIIRSANSYLRAHSSLYVWLRGFVTDPQTRYWQSELANYQRLSDEALAEILDPIRNITELYNTAEVPFTVFIMPFAGQMELTESSLPQQKLASFFANEGIDYIDLLPRFRAGKHPKKFFLPYDPMHLSPAGHEILFQVIRERINQIRSRR